MCSESCHSPASSVLAVILGDISLSPRGNCPNLSAWHLHCHTLLTKKSFHYFELVLKLEVNSFKCIHLLPEYPQMSHLMLPVETLKRERKGYHESSSINKKRAVQLHSIALSSEVSSFSSQRPLSAPPYQTMVLNLVQERGKSLLLFLIPPVLILSTQLQEMKLDYVFIQDSLK